MQTVLITGGTGLIGTALTGLLLQKGYRVIILTREPDEYAADDPSVQYAAWNVEEQRMDKTAVARADHIIHLAGANVASRRWTTERKLEIVESRTQGSALLVDTLKQVHHHVKSVISASAIGWYGADEKSGSDFTESAPPAPDFLGITCKAWESSIEPVRELGIRLVKLRTGIVLSRAGGALAEFKRPLRAGIATVLGSGEQKMSWIQLEDLCRMYLFAMENESITGVYNAVAPGVTSQKKLVLELARLLRRNFFIPVHVPRSLVRLALGEMSTEVLKSTRVSAGKITAAGFEFLYPGIEAALPQCV